MRTRVCSYHQSERTLAHQGRHDIVRSGRGSLRALPLRACTAAVPLRALQLLLLLRAVHCCSPLRWHTYASPPAISFSRSHLAPQSDPTRTLCPAPRRHQPNHTMLAPCTRDPAPYTPGSAPCAPCRHRRCDGNFTVAEIQISQWRVRGPVGHRSVEVDDPAATHVST